jgi:hypothetical protein
MDIDAIIKSQQDWIERAIAATAPAEAPELDASAPDAMRESATKVARERLSRLESQREATLRRLDAAIQEEKAALAHIETLGRGDAGPSKDPARPRPARPATGKAPDSGKKK